MIVEGEVETQRLVALDVESAVGLVDDVPSGRGERITVNAAVLPDQRAVVCEGSGETEAAVTKRVAEGDGATGAMVRLQ